MIQILRIRNVIQIKDLKPKIDKLRDDDQAEEKYRLTNFTTFNDQHTSHLFYKLKWTTHPLHRHGLSPSHWNHYNANLSTCCTYRPWLPHPMMSTINNMPLSYLTPCTDTTTATCTDTATCPHSISVLCLTANSTSTITCRSKTWTPPCCTAYVSPSLSYWTWPVPIIHTMLSPQGNRAPHPPWTTRRHLWWWML